MGNEEFKTPENISQQELLAREFENWQKSYYDDVHNFFAEGNEERGYAALESWEKRFSRFLHENFLEKHEEYKKTTSGKMRVKTMGSSALSTFQRWRGNKIEAFLAQCIDDARKGYLEEYLPASKPSNIAESQQAKTEHVPSIFISHSSNDAELAQLLVDLVRAALNIPSKEIRCTSLDGYRLPVGADIDNQIKSEILQSTTLIGLISEKSFDSAYVLFELGARWSTDKYLIPLLAPGMDPNELKGPIIGYNALRCDSNSQLHQLVENIAKQLNLELENPSAYQKKIDDVLDFAKTSN